MRLGDFTVDGGIRLTYTDVNPFSPVLYLFDSTARTAVGNADFVRVMPISGGTNIAARFDCQGDAGAGTMNIPGAATPTYAHETTIKNIVWNVKSGNFVVVPASLFGTSDTTRTGMFQSSASAVTWLFQFCSWNPSSNP